MKNPRNYNTVELLAEEQRLLALIDKLAEYRHGPMRSNRERATLTLRNVQRELNSRAAA